MQQLSLEELEEELVEEQDKEELVEELDNHLPPFALASSMDVGANFVPSGGFERRRRELGKNGIRLFVAASSSIARTTTRARSF